MRNTLVVGGAGYIGGHLTDLLCQKAQMFGDPDPTVYDILAYEERFMKQVPFIYGDIRDRAKLKEILPKFDTVVWLAAIVGDGACAADPFLTQAVNADATKWLVDSYDGKIIFTSTCSVYGVNNDLITEDATPNPLSVYAETKLEAEQYILQHAADRSVVFRLGTLYGVGDLFSRIRLDLVANILSKKAARGEKLTVFGGDQWRPMIHVKDVGEAIRYAVHNEDLTGLYNLSTDNFRIREIADEIKMVIPECEVEKIDMLFEDQRNYRVSTKRWDSIQMHDMRTPRPQWTLRDGIYDIVNLVTQNRIKNLGSPIYSNQAHINDNYRRWL
jgi:nucleoside-diphosphate-sugar epimerase